jgi:hypothetical protein
MAKLAILGHATRGKEVIGLLKMLGGKNDNHCCGGFLNSIYFINNYGYIESCDRMQHLDYLQFTLEEFFELYPFKVGDEVLINDDENDVYTVKSMEWQKFFDRVIYRIEALDGRKHHIDTWFAHEMVLFNPKKEESMEEKLMPRIDLTRYCKDKYILDLGDYEIKEENDVTYMIHKKPQYPKTYAECCKVLNIPFNGDIIYGGNWTHGEEYLDKHLDIIRNFQKLKICRDAYWKIVGEQMGLCEPWEPQFENSNIPHYCIFINHTGKVYKDCFYGNRCLLVFPTAEMRDAFYENFKDLIEQCKDFL